MNAALELLAFVILFSFLVNGCATETPPSSTDAVASRYSRTMHDRFYEAWMPPGTVAAPPGKFTAVVDAQIDREGRVLSFNIVRSSGVEAIDKSVAAVGREVARVEPPPVTSSKRPFDLKIYFDLDVKS